MSWLRKLRTKVRRALALKVEPRWLARAYPQYRIGKHSYGELAVSDFGEGTVFTMGDYCSTAAGSRVLLGGGHRLEWATTYPFSILEKKLAGVSGHPVSRGDVSVGNDVWIASDAIILSGVTIGDGAAVMARSVVTRDVPPYAIVGGTPAKVVKYRFEERTIARLLALKWWDWPHSRIVAAARMMMSPDIEDFLDRAERNEI